MSDTPQRGWFSFSIRDLLWLTAIVAVVLWALYVKPAAAPPAPPTVGRFMLVRMQLEPSQGRTVLVDTATGQCWWQNGANWIDEKTPPSQKK